MKMPACILVFTVLTTSALMGCDGSGGWRPGLAPGTAAPSFQTKTLQDVGGDFSKITTYREPDARMYQYSEDAALKTGKPIVIEFATPGHCTVCDAQLQELKAMLDKYQGQVIFIHFDQYENPQAFKEFQVMGDPWTFVIDSKGIVRFQQPGRMLFSEMDRAVQKALSPS